MDAPNCFSIDVKNLIFETFPSSHSNVSRCSTVPQIWLFSFLHPERSSQEICEDELMNKNPRTLNKMLRNLHLNGSIEKGFILTFAIRFSSLAAHINHIKNTAGIDHVGLGAGFDGIN